ncbi:hypothetical protein CISIN_1g021901mg [Citrus sinensis]|uniref:Carbonic anhydrase n=1 Tax=Citrus sinensis TaxID=2711 RepID=A0A067E8I9_CITSI|nr:hypothetical protein CISIN_1g021901mg [Citrus sinensis]
MAILAPASVSKDPLPSSSSALTPLRSSTQIFGPKFKFRQIGQTQLSLSTSFKKSSGFKLKGWRHSEGITQEFQVDKLETAAEVENECDFFDKMKHRFLSFKKQKFMENLEHYQNLADGQAPKFMVIACADSRVCPSNILGFQPGEAFIVRNVANMVPPCESGPSETNAALEFAVNSVKVSLLFCKFIVKVSMFLRFQGNYYFDELDPSILES